MAAAVIGTLAVLLVVAIGASLLAPYVVNGAPPVPCSAREAQDVIALLRQANLPDNPTLVELGCGWGGLARALADAFPAATVVGIEASPLPALVAAVRGQSRANLEIVRANFHRVSLAHADAVTTYLMIKPMVPLAVTLDRELRTGTAVVTLAFWFRDRRQTATLNNAALYRWPAARR